MSCHAVLWRSKPFWCRIVSWRAALRSIAHTYAPKGNLNTRGVLGRVSMRPAQLMESGSGGTQGQACLLSGVRRPFAAACGSQRARLGLLQACTRFPSVVHLGNLLSRAVLIVLVDDAHVHLRHAGVQGLGQADGHASACMAEEMQEPFQALRASKIRKWRHATQNPSVRVRLRGPLSYSFRGCCFY